MSDTGTGPGDPGEADPIGAFPGADLDPDAVYASPDLPPVTRIAPPPDEAAPWPTGVSQPPWGPEPQAPAPPSEGPEPMAFNPKVREDLEGLLFLGRLEKTFRFWGHRFVVRTLTVEDHLEIGQLIASWKDTYAETLSWQAAVVAAAVVSVDGQPLPVPMGEGETRMGARFRWAQSQYPWTIAAVWEEHLELEDRVREAIAAAGKVSGGLR